jgi:septum formation topological specificity factor MinE
MMDEKKTSDTANTRLGIILAQRSEVLGLGSGRRRTKMLAAALE